MLDSGWDGDIMSMFILHINMPHTLPQPSPRARCPLSRFGALRHGFNIILLLLALLALGAGCTDSAKLVRGKGTEIRDPAGAWHTFLPKLSNFRVDSRYPVQLADPTYLSAPPLSAQWFGVTDQSSDPNAAPPPIKVVVFRMASGLPQDWYVDIATRNNTTTSSVVIGDSTMLHFAISGGYAEHCYYIAEKVGFAIEFEVLGSPSSCLNNDTSDLLQTMVDGFEVL